jgi:nucleotide-binding universal stress UspA family protein
VVADDRKGVEMFSSVIIGVDGRSGGRDAIALARKLVGEDGHLALAHVYLSDPVPGRGASGAFEAEDRARARDVLEAARAQADIEAELLSRGSASVGRGLHELAEGNGADLLVVGSSARGLIGRVLTGDDTRAALSGAPCAVAVAPAGYAERPAALSEIGVGYSGSPESEHALAVARDLAAQHGARVSAFEAVSVPSYAFAGGNAGAVAEALEGYVKDARERIAGLGDVEPHAAYGVAAEELALYGASVDLLVIGSRGYGPIGRLVHGSTSRQLARTARCPLLVLTRAAVARDASGQSEAGRERPAATTS